MEETAVGQERLQFGEFTLDGTRAALFRDGAPVHLRRQSYEVLRYLAGHAGRLVTKDELFAAVWPGSVVTDDSLTQCLVEIRRAIGDDGHDFIRTVPRRGFVFDIPVEPIGGEEAPGGAAVPQSSRSDSRRWGWLGVAAAVLLGSTALWWVSGWETERAGDTVPASAGVSIAVLPFADLSDAQDQQYFAEGLSEEILNQLAQLPDLRVIARTSSFSFRGRPELDVRAIGRRLGVTHLLEGSVRRSGDRLRVSAQLVQSSDGGHLWSRIYDLQAGDALNVQREIAGAVARTLEIRFATPEGRTGEPAIDPAAHEQYLLARFLWGRRSPGDLEAAQAHLERAVSLDPKHAQAWALLSGIRYIRIFNDGQDAVSALEAMRVAIGRALTLAPESGEVHARAAQFYAAMADFDRAADHWERAHALAPNNMLVITFSGAFLRGDFAEALRQSRRAVELDPVNVVNRFNLSMMLMINGRLEEAWQEIQRVRQLGPDTQGIAEITAELLVLQGRYAGGLEAAHALPEGPDRERLLVLAYDGLGRRAEAEAAFAALRAREDGLSLHRIAEIHAWRGESDAAFEGLERAWQAMSAEALVPGERAHPTHFLDSGFLRPLHGDPRLERYFVHLGRDVSN